MSSSRKYLCGAILLVAVLFGLIWNPSVAFAQSAFAQSYKELLERSEKEKKGLTFYVKGQTIAGVVVKMTPATRSKCAIKPSAGSSFDWTASTLWR